MIALLALAFAVLVILLCAYHHPQFFKAIVSRDGKISSKKLWYNFAGATATACLLWITYKDDMEDWTYICFYSIYLVTVGGFEVMLKMMAMIIEFKNGRSTTTTTLTELKEEKTE